MFFRQVVVCDNSKGALGPLCCCMGKMNDRFLNIRLKHILS